MHLAKKGISTVAQLENTSDETVSTYKELLRKHRFIENVVEAWKELGDIQQYVGVLW